MAYLTEYIDNYRQRPIKKVSPFNPERKLVKLEGKWLDPKLGKTDKALTDEEIKEFIAKTMKELRGQSTYYNDYCGHWPEDLKTREFVPRRKKKIPCKPEEIEEMKSAENQLQNFPKPLALKDTEVMKKAAELYERDMNEPTLEPLQTHFRIHGYVRPSRFKTGLSEYTESYARLAYETVRDGKTPQYFAHNGHRPRWGYPPDGVRQPLLDGAPFDGERLC